MIQKAKIFPFSQTLYYFISAVWPLVDIESFMRVTGEKTDLWLAKTIGVLLLPYVFLLLYLTFSYKRNFIIVVPIMICCTGLLTIDVYYYFSREIRWVYLVDGAFQLVFFLYWTYYLMYSRDR